MSDKKSKERKEDKKPVAEDKKAKGAKKGKEKEKEKAKEEEEAAFDPLASASEEEKKLLPVLRNAVQVMV